MSIFNLVVAGFDTIKRLMEEAQRQQRSEMRAFVVRQAQEVITGLQQRTPAKLRNRVNYSFVVEEKTNEVRADVLMRQEKDAGKLKFSVTGTVPHRIVGHPLRWYDKQGVPHFAMFVQHPGIKPNPNLVPQDDDLSFVADFVAGQTRK